MEDIENWNSEKEAIYKKKHEEKERLRKLEETRKAEAAQRKIEAEKRRKAAEEAERLRKKKEAEKGSGSEQESEEDKPENPVEEKNEGAAEAKVEEPVEEVLDDGEKSAMQLKYEALMKQYEADEADDEDEFVPLEIKTKIHAFRKENPDAKKIPSELLSEAFRWRLSQNDCQNRGYVLDGYPLCYKTALEVFVVTPP